MSPIRDFTSGHVAVATIQPQAVTAAGASTVTGDAVDFTDYGNVPEEVGVLIVVGDWTTDGATTFEIQEADESVTTTGAAGTFTAVAAADLLGSEPSVTDSGGGAQVYEIGYVGDQRFLRVEAVTAGQTTGSVAFSALVVMADAGDLS